MDGWRHLEKGVERLEAALSHGENIVMAVGAVTLVGVFALGAMRKYKESNANRVLAERVNDLAESGRGK